MKKKRILCLFLATVCAVSLSGCTDQKSSLSSDAIEKVLNDLENKIQETVSEAVSEAMEAYKESENTEEEPSEPVTEEETENTEETEDTEEAENTEEAESNSPLINIPESELSDVPLLFKTKTLDNETVTSDIFMDYDITVLYIWATYCGACIEEMDEYADFYKALPDNVNLVGLVSDTMVGDDYNLDLAYDILNDAGATFMNLRLSEGLYDVMNEINYLPSALLVNRSGRIIGEILDGDGIDTVKRKLEAYIG